LRKSSAFTLIELLVVIAIIAILAAILFPVFAQAKLAAKAAATVSNNKQNALSLIMYSGDFDDVMVTDTNWNTGSDPLSFGSGLAFSTWGYMCQPYTKNGDVLIDVTGPSTPTMWGSRALTMSSYPGFGYNYTWMAPYGPESPNRQKPISATAAAAPADTVMLASRGSYADGDHNFWGFDFTPFTTDTPLLNVGVESPNCNPIPQYCVTNWGVGGSLGITKNNVAGGYNTGEVALHSSNMAIVAFMDGHVKKMTPGALAAGTNWNPTIKPSSLVYTNPLIYLWSVQKSADGNY